MYETWYKMTVMLGAVDIAPVITHRFEFEKFEKAFETALSGESGGDFEMVTNPCTAS